MSTPGFPQSDGLGARRRRAVGGFTVAEFLVIGTILLITALVGFTAIQNLVDRARIQGIVQATATQMQMARFEAIKTGLVVVAQPDFDADDILFFVNVDGDVGFRFNPDDSKPHRTADYELIRLRLPTDYDVAFWGPGDPDPEGNHAIEGFTTVGGSPNAVVFQPGGSVRDSGAIRFGDKRGNILEVRVEPRSTARVEVRKFHPDPPWGGPPGFFPAGRHEGSGKPMWEWY